MNAKKKARTTLFSNTNSQETTSKSEQSKHNLLTPCRRVGLNRKRNKSLGVSPTPIESTRSTNIFVEDDLKNITETADLSHKSSTVEDDLKKITETTDLSHKSSTIVSDKIQTTISSSYYVEQSKKSKSKIGIKKKTVSSQRKRKIDSDEDRTFASDLSQGSSRAVSPVIVAKKVKETKDSDKSKNESMSSNINTIPVSINLTRCDLNALKIKLTSPENKRVDTSEIMLENKENLPDVQNKKTDENITNLVKENVAPLNVESTTVEENFEESNHDSQLENAKESSVLKFSNIPAGNNSLEENSEGSDFYPNVTRRKKKKVLTTKQRNISKPGPSQQKENTSTNKRISANNTPCYSDSDDDFVTTPVRRDRKNSMKSENNSQNSEKEDKVKKRKLKLKKPMEDELNKTGHIRISENKSYTIIHRDNSVSYVKSFDNDVNFKVTESDDNQQLPRNSIELPKKTMIIERKDYITKRRNSSSENAQMLIEMPSIFTDIMNNVDSLAQEFQQPPIENTENPENNKEISNKMPQKINVIETSKLQNTKSTENKTPEAEHSHQNEKSETPEKISLPESAEPQSDEKYDHQNKSTSVQMEDPKIPEEKNTNENENSGETSESENNSETSETDSIALRSILHGHELREMNVKQLTDELATLEASVKKKQERLESLQRISVYKETHNLEELREVTLQIKRGCQSALVDLVLSLKQQSNADFTMATLLEFMKIPNDLVGYNEQEDKFI